MQVEKKAGRTWLLLAAIAALGVLILGCGSGSIAALFQTPTPTLTSTPTPTLTPTITPTPTTGNLMGKIVEAPLKKADSLRPALNDALVVLCLKTSADVCVVDENLSAKSNDSANFSIEAIPPGEYVVLYNPFPIDDIAAFWSYWDGRELDFSDANTLFKSMTQSGDINISAGEDGGVSLKIVNQKMQPVAVLGNTAIWLKASPLVFEFVERQEILSVEITAGHNTDITINSHAKIFDE